jgi:hypothetical protein
VVAPRPIDRSTRHAENPRPGQLEGADGQFKITATQQRILDALAWLESIGNDQPSTLQVGAIALIDATGGHFSNTVGPLSSNGLDQRGPARFRSRTKGANTRGFRNRFRRWLIITTCFVNACAARISWRQNRRHAKRHYQSRRRGSYC